MRLTAEDMADIRRAVDTLRRGGVIVYPTDTVWGIGCDATNSAAVRRVFDIKRRADSKALITLVGSVGALERVVDQVPEVAYDLIDFSEKPLTIIYDSASGVAPELKAADGTVAVRVTSEVFSQALCRAFGRPLVSTSANISGQPAARCFAEISPEILDRADYVCEYGRDTAPGAKPSTIMRLSAGGLFKVIRP